MVGAMESFLSPAPRPRATFRSLLQFPAGHRSPADAKLAWLVKLRWAALALAFAFVVPALSLGLLARADLSFYMGVLGCTGLFNLFTVLLLRERSRAAGADLLVLQMVFDLFALTALLRLMGGLANPLAVVFYLHVVLGGVLLQRGRSWLFLLCLHGALAWLQAASFRVPLAQQNFAWLLLPHLVVLLFWHTVHFLGKHLDLQHRLLLGATVAAEKQDRLRALGALTAGFSHEFASPLQTLRLRLDRLARENETNADIIAAREALADCTRVLHAMNQSPVDPRVAAPREADLARLAREIAERWAGENRAVELALEEGLHQKVSVVGFAQVLINLLDNAAEAAPGGRIRLSLAEEAGRLTLRVEDQGPGLPRQVLARLGEPFNTTKPAGTGLGLYVTELFALSVNGSLVAENLPGGGAAVGLRWPVAGETNEGARA